MIKNKFSALIVALTLLVANACLAQQIAITIDNPNTEKKPLVSAKGRDKSILAALNKHHLKAILFVQGSQVNNPAGHALLQRWSDAGQLFGNHTYSHRSFNDIDVEEYEADMLRNEALLTPYANFTKIFRFPFLKEGSSAENRDDFRLFLQDHGYQNGSVTIDTSDWYISDRLEASLAKNPYTDINLYRKYYLNHVWNRAQYYDKLARSVLGRSPKHTLLVHHNLLNALFLDDVIQMFKDKGWKVIDADAAFKDPVFQKTPNTVPAGESLIWALAKQTGRYDAKLRYPGEDEKYEKNAMDKLGL